MAQKDSSDDCSTRDANIVAKDFGADLEAGLTSAEVARRLVKDGPDALNKRELSAVMYDPDIMLRLHYDLWSGSGDGLSAWWDTAIRQYNILTREPVTALYR